MSGPNPDGRRREDVLEYATEIAPHYTDDWDPEADDAGRALLEVFADLAAEVTERVDRVPRKHRVAFYDTLGFSRRPPQAARLPLSVTVADGVAETVTVPPGTQAVGGTPERTFEVLPGDGFEATPAQPTSAYSVAPGDGQIYEHDELLDGGDATLFGGADGRQEHALHVGHAGQLAVEGSADDPTAVAVTVRTRTEASALADRLEWAFYGERDGEEGWHGIEATAASGGDGPGDAPDGHSPYEELLAAVLRAAAAVLRRLADELDPATLEALAGAIRDVAAVLGEVAAREDVQEPLAQLLEEAEVLADRLADGPAREAVEELAEALERLADDLGAGPLAETLEANLLPVVESLPGALEDGPVGDAVRDDLEPALEGLFEAVEADAPIEDLQAELDEVVQVLREGAGTGQVVDALAEAIEGLDEQVDLDPQAVVEAGDEPAEAPAREFLRALADALAQLRAELVGSALVAAVRALASVLDRLGEQLEEGSLDEPLEAITRELEALREAVEVDEVRGVLEEAAETVTDRLEELDGSPVGDAVRTDLGSALVALEERLREDDAVRAVVEALVALSEVLTEGPVGQAVRDDGAEAVEHLADGLGESPLGSELGPLLDALDELAAGLRSGRFRSAALRTAVRRELAESTGTADGEEAGAVPQRRLTLDVDGTVTETAVDGIESRWIRCTVPEDEWGSDLFGTRIGERDAPEEYAAPVGVGPVPAGEVPTEKLLTNGTELSVDEDGFYPLGQEPRRQDAFYVASEEAFTKAGATVEVAFGADRSESVEFDIDPEVAWEYWDGDAWSRLGLVRPEPEVVALRRSGSVRFEVPADLESTTVSGHEGYWVRARLADGSYGRFEARERSGSSGTEEGENVETDGGSADGESWVTEHRVAAPRFADVSVQYAAAGLVRPAAHLLARNNLAYGPDLAAAERRRFQPFVGLADTEQALYLGFDRPLEDGPIPFLFDFEEVQYREGFHPRVRWERRTAGGQWTPVDVRDGTESFTERGLVRLSFAEATESTALFGRERHWLRARVTGSAFTGASTDGEATASAVGGVGDLEPCARRVRTDPPAGEPGRDRPTVSGLYRNTGWAHDVRTVEDEFLGSSDGTQDQTVTVSSPPAMDVELWVDEREALSDARRRELRESDDRAVDPGPETFWVRWTAVDSLLDSDGDDRHYAIDRASGRISFGDGNRGRIPPRGRDNVKASYRTGGGAGGNVPAGAVGDLKTSIPFVDAVTNPIPADGGADAEAVDGVLDRASKELRDRGRAVTEADVERVALDASRQLARARCISAMDRAGDRAPGWVTLLVVPGTAAEKPTPSVTLRERVWRTVSERAAATLVADPDHLVVRGPSYVTVSVDATLATAGVGSLSRIEETATAAVADFLHPLSGGPDGDGWGFGDPPCHSDFYALLEGIDGVDHVDELVVRFRGTDSTVSVREGDTAPNMAADTLVHSGSHDLRATAGDRSGGP